MSARTTTNVYHYVAYGANRVPDDVAVRRPAGADVTYREVDLAGYQKPRRNVFREAFTRTATRKVDRVALAEEVGGED